MQAIDPPYYFAKRSFDTKNAARMHSPAAFSVLLNYEKSTLIVLQYP